MTCYNNLFLEFLFFDYKQEFPNVKLHKFNGKYVPNTINMYKTKAATFEVFIVKRFNYILYYSTRNKYNIQQKLRIHV